MSPDELVLILDTFGAQDFVQTVERVRGLVGMAGTSISGGRNPVPTRNLQRIYKIRASNVDLRPALARQDDQLARIAGQFPSERWYIYTVANGGVQVAIFSNEEGVGRACIDFGAQ